MLRLKVFDAEQVEAIVKDYHRAGLPAAEVAMLAFAEKIIQHAYKVTPRDIDGLRSHGFTAPEILDIAAAASARSFFSKLIDALGAEPDQAYQALEPDLRNALVVGRPYRSGP
ncbi:MAG: hypothetical protein HYU43_02415 [Armatimonadetes bacterium]|nr:hypothetical protein [Armatimonadota bacterium]